MTKQEAKALEIEVWQYLADHPEIDDRKRLPYEITEKIRHFLYRCPLCEIFTTDRTFLCIGCPIDSANETCYESGSAFNLWDKADYYADRRQAAQKILDIIKAWEPEEETE